jgi:hypothetical protein
MAGAWRRLRSALVGRFDGAVLRACEWPADADSMQLHDALGPDGVRAVADLRAWCLSGAGSGARPWFYPGAGAKLPAPLAFRSLADSPASEAGRLATLLCLDLDQSLQLHALGSAAGRMALRLRVKVQDAAWWRARLPTDPWDTGYARTDTQALAAWSAFRPRRPTLVVLKAARPEAGACRAALLSAQGAFDHPVRVLTLPPDAHMPA